MTPIHELINRIRWDKKCGQGRFEIGYLDRFDGVVHRIALQKILFPEDAHHAFEVVDESAQVRRIPFHRVREVSKDGQIIWQRPPSQ